MKKMLAALTLVCIVCSLISVIAPNVKGLELPIDSTMTLPISPTNINGSANITASTPVTGNASISMPDIGEGTINLSSPPFSTPIMEKEANGSYVWKTESRWSNHWWSIDYWANPSGGQLPPKMNGTFVAVPNTISGLESGDHILYLPLNVAYGTSSTNCVWFQFDVDFDSSGNVRWYIWDIVYPFHYPDDFHNQNIGNHLAYTPWHTYNFALTTSGTNTVTFTIKDVTTGSSWSTSTWQWTIPGLTMIYHQSAFSPASAIEGYTTNSELRVPYFQTYVGYGETTHYHANYGSVPTNIATAIWTGGSNYYYWAMISKIYFVTNINEYGTYGPGSSVLTPENLIFILDNKYAKIYGANYGDGGYIIGQMTTFAGGNIYIRGCSLPGYYSDLYVYVSNDYQNWIQVGSRLRITQTTPYWISVGTVHFDFQYIAVAGYDSGFSVRLHLDCVRVGEG